MKVLRALAVFVAIAALAHLATVAALPWAINALVMHQIRVRALADSSPDLGPVHARRGYNVALRAARADASARTVVRPSPDLLYTACVFDLSAGALRLTTPLPGSYVSISGFAADTTNFFALNDRSPTNHPGTLELVVTREPLATETPGLRVVVAPSTRGLILFRTLITSESDLERLRSEVQARQTCEPA